MKNTRSSPKQMTLQIGRFVLPLLLLMQACGGSAGDSSVPADAGAEDTHEGAHDTEEDTSGAAEDTSGAVEDTSGTAEDTSGTAEDTSGPAEDTSGPAEDTSGPAEDTSGPAEDTGQPADDTGPRPDMGGVMAASDFTVRVPSGAGGVEGIAVRVITPTSPGRYSTGSPIAVGVPGGWGANSATVEYGLVDHGIISVGWVVPGASTQDGSSGGVYDVRGPNCLRALADVILYAMGELADTDGRRITDRVPHALTEEVGLIAGSNGGNLAITAMAVHADELASISWLGAWESPLGDQQANVELNDNPYYTPGNCTATRCPFDEEFAMALTWDPNGTTEARHDRMESVRGSIGLDGAPDNIFAGMPGGYVDGNLRLYPSQELAAALRRVSNDLFGAEGPPQWLILDPASVETYWRTRDGSLQIPTVHATNPDLRIIHLQRVTDHVQSQPDYPHATAHLLGWRDAGHAWFRLNPDAAYQALVLGDVSATSIPENDANTVVAFPGAVDQMIPNALAMDIKIAGVLELVDRTHFDDSSADLTGALFNYEPSSGGTEGATDCDEMRMTRCCGDDVCDGPETASNCPEDC